MLKIWGRISSINVRKVVLCAQMLDIPFVRMDAGLSFGVVNTPDYLALNPNAMVPTIEDGPYTLWESNVIVRYLCAREGRLYPSDLRTRFMAEQWMDWQQTTLKLSMADIPLACEVHRWWGLPQSRPSWPHLERWYAQMRQHPGAAGVLDLALS